MSRLLPASAYARLKAATAAAIAASPQGSADAFAEATRVGGRMLRKYADHSTPEFAPLDVIADLEAATHEPIVARVLADLSGCVLAPKVIDDEASALSAIKGANAASAAIAGLLISGVWGRAEAQGALGAVRGAIEALSAIEAQLKHKAGGRS